MATRHRAVDMGETSMTASQLAGHLEGLIRRVRDGSWGQRHFAALAEGRDPFAMPRGTDKTVEQKLAWWRDHYQRIYRINPDWSGLVIPEPRPGFERLELIPKGFQMKLWVETASRIHGLDLYANDLDGAVPEHERTAKERSYAIWLRDRPEADEELQDLSAGMIASQGLTTMTLPERLVADTAYLFETGRHLDEENITLCSGSRYSDGRVPSVRWDSGARQLCVDWCSPVSRGVRLRARAVVSLAPSR